MLPAGSQIVDVQIKGDDEPVRNKGMRQQINQVKTIVLF